jgi:hypothetical protein
MISSIAIDQTLMGRKFTKFSLLRARVSQH